MGGKRIQGTPDALRREAVACSLRALRLLTKVAELEKRAKYLERKRENWERQEWPEAFCKSCATGKECVLHRKTNTDAVPERIARRDAFYKAIAKEQEQDK